MKPVSRITGTAVSLPAADIDTDVILPARFLLLLSRENLGRHLFADLRKDPAFALNRPGAGMARILIAGPRFGIGSSREQAVWALADHGFECIIAPSFGEIFHANCINNGILPITMQGSDYDQIRRKAETGAVITVDLPAQTAQIDGQPAIRFAIDRADRQRLLAGIDPLDEIVRDHADAITEFELRQRDRSPWLWLDAEQVRRVVNMGASDG